MFHLLLLQFCKEWIIILLSIRLFFWFCDCLCSSCIRHINNFLVFFYRLFTNVIICCLGSDLQLLALSDLGWCSIRTQRSIWALPRLWSGRWHLGPCWNEVGVWLLLLLLTLSRARPSLQVDVWSSEQRRWLSFDRLSDECNRRLSRVSSRRSILQLWIVLAMLHWCCSFVAWAGIRHNVHDELFLG